MSTQPDDSFPLPTNFGPGSVWADRVGERTLVGRTQRGVEIPIGTGEGEVSPGELLKLALIGCAGMSADFAIGRRLGPDFRMRLFAHGLSDKDTNRYPEIAEEIQLDLAGLDADGLERLRAVIDRAIAAGCTVERTVVPGAAVRHRLLDPQELSEP
ncbi:OsmC family protein [Nigerium massiliense]|uniref:OsmC family protein n=1 Tax=Nigerium massiliense TaxID=1522317 RepID=UPI00059179EF|nr:OsmC family protein [Nigerium massiliense]